MRLARSSTRPAWTVLVLMAGLVASVGVARSAAYSSTVIAATSAGSIVAIFVGIRWHHPPARRFWRLTTAALLAGILAGGLGTVYADSLLWTVAIDLTFVVGYLLFVAAGLLLLPKGRGRHNWASTLDATTLGIAGALAASSVLESVLFEVKSRDPWTFATVGLGLLAVCAIATYLPARQAVSGSPAMTLHERHDTLLAVVCLDC